MVFFRFSFETSWHFGSIQLTGGSRFSHVFLQDDARAASDAASNDPPNSFLGFMWISSGDTGTTIGANAVSVLFENSTILLDASSWFETMTNPMDAFALKMDSTVTNCVFTVRQLRADIFAKREVSLFYFVDPMDVGIQQSSLQMDDVVVESYSMNASSPQR